MSQHQRDKQAYLNATPMQREVVRRHLCDVLACLRAQYLSYQTSHWQVVGQSFYGNHLLFQRLYESVQEQVDQLAEKLVGYLGREVVGLDSQIKHIAGYTMRWSQIDCHHKRGLQSEADLQAALKRSYDGIKQVNAMTLGLDDWIMATANAHEENEYLLQQALTPVPGQKQAGNTAEDMFQFNPERREVLEFSETGAISNSPEVAAAASEEDQLDMSKQEAVELADEAPPTPTEIKEQPGGAGASTLNRLVVNTEDPAIAPAVKMNQSRMAAWLRELE